MPGANVASAPITEFCPHQEKGLTDEEAAASAAQHGNNRLTKKRHRGFFACFLQNFRDPIIKILLGALLLNTLLSLRDINWPESIGIASAVLMATLVSTISEAGSEKAFEKLSEKDGNALYTVRRNGTLRRIPLVDIVCGDILLISAGMLVPADGVLLSGHLETNQAALTGESENVIKKPGKWHASLTEESISNLSDPAFLFRGSTISSGEGEMMVLRVGDKTFYEYVMENTPQDFMMVLDTGNVQDANGDPIELVRKYPGRTPTAHIKGYSQEKKYLTPVWESELDWDVFFPLVLNEGGAKIFDIEFGSRGGYDPIERAAQSAKWLKEMLEKYGK